MPDKKNVVSPKDFVLAWEGSESLAEVAEKTGIPGPVAAARASLYRKYGINLKFFKTGRKKGIDVAELNKLIEVMGGRPAEETWKESPAEQVEGKSEEQLREEQKRREQRNAETLKKLLGDKKK